MTDPALGRIHAHVPRPVGIALAVIGGMFTLYAELVAAVWSDDVRPWLSRHLIALGRRLA